MTVSTDVKRAIIGAAVSVIGNTYPVKVPGITFTPPNNQKYIELVLITDDNENETWGSEQLYSGVLRVILHWPIDGLGIYPPSEVIDTIGAEFPKGRVIVRNLARLLIYQNPRASDPIESGTENLYPLTVAYQYFHAPT